MGCLCRGDSPFGLTAPQFVSPYRISGRRGKNDAADAAAICEAVTRPNMRFFPVKEEHQQIIPCLHRTRQGFVEERTAIYNRIRGLISEFGIIRTAWLLACGSGHRREECPAGLGGAEVRRGFPVAAGCRLSRRQKRLQERS